MKKSMLLTLASILFIYGPANAQEGKPSVKIYSNFNYDMSAKEGEDAFKEFEVKRAYLGYSYNFNEKFSTKITFDVGSNEGGSEYTAFLKIASLNWQASEKLNIGFGMIGAKNFKFMEKAWGRRFIEKSAQDNYEWASAADAGVNAEYKLSSNISIDAQLLNGEGYKELQDSTNSKFRGGAGITLKVMPQLTLRAYYDISPRTQYTDSLYASENIITAAAVYSSKLFTIGAETNMMKNAENMLNKEHELMSVYGSLKISRNYTLFGRYDDATNTDEAETFMIYGIEREMIKGVTVALNMQSTKKDIVDAEAENTLFLNFEYKF